jgi:hypothetical protein
VVSMLASRVRSRPKPSDFSGEKILSMPSFGREVKPFVPFAPCRRFAACQRTLYFIMEVANYRLNCSDISRPLPFLANRGLWCRLTQSASGDDGRN